MSTNGEFPHFVIDEDQKAVGSGTEPPEYPAGTRVGQCGWRQRPEKGGRREQRTGVGWRPGPHPRRPEPGDERGEINATSGV